MQQPPRSGSERRREPRFPVDIPVIYMRGPIRCPGKCLDLSYSGMLVELDEMAEGAESELVRVEIAFPDERSLTVPAVIARRIERKMGLLLFGISGDPERIWKALVAKIIKKHPPKPPSP